MNANEFIQHLESLGACAAARKENQQMTADIVREVLPFEIWEF